MPAWLKARATHTNRFPLILAAKTATYRYIKNIMRVSAPSIGAIQKNVKRAIISLHYALLGGVVFSAFAFPQYSVIAKKTPVSPIEIAVQESQMLDEALEEAQNFLNGPPLVEGAMVQASLNPQHPPKTMWIVVTAYSSTPDQTDGDPFITASGKRVRDGIIAANFLPMYTKVRFPDIYGNKVFVVEDRMNRRYYYRADIWMETRAQAKHFGLRNIRIEILP
jgi:3D (Asp-Asp-Asp) domain-containing protein